MQGYDALWLPERTMPIATQIRVEEDPAPRD